jgi:hypothetical protein
MQRDDEYEDTDAGYDDDAPSEQLRAIANDLQFGDSEEGARALQRLMKQQGGSDEQLAQQMQRVLKKQQVSAEIREAVSAFERKNATVAGDPLLGQAGMTAIRHRIKEDLVNAGVPEDKIRPFENSDQHMIQAYQGALEAGRPVRRPRELIDAAATDLRKRFPGVRSISQRDPAEIVRDMRSQRGFSAEDDGTHGVSTRNLPGGDSAGSARRAPGTFANVRRVEASESSRPDPRARIEEMRKQRGYAPST